VDKIVILLTTVAEIWHRINSTLGVTDDIQKLRQQPAKLGSLENGCPTSDCGNYSRKAIT